MLSPEIPPKRECGPRLRPPGRGASAHVAGLRACAFLGVLLLVLLWSIAAAAQSGGPGQPLVHVVQPGETLFSIARRYGTTVEALTHANGISDPRHLYAGQRLLIVGSAGWSESWATHVVRAGENLWAIARQYGLDWQVLALANRLVNPNLILVGQVLRVPQGPLAPAAGAPYAVRSGETLTGIALKHGLCWWEVMEANREVSGFPLILAGRWLLLPGLRPSWLPAPFETVNLRPLPVGQGRVLLVEVRTNGPVNLEGTLFDRPLRFAEEGGTYYALVGVHAFTEPGLYELNLTARQGNSQRTSLSVEAVVEEGGYGYERIDLPPSRASLLDPVLIAAERERLEAIRSLYTPVRRWNGPFLPPVEATISSYFGTRRSYNGGPYNSYHEGVDFDAGAGAPVRAPADGTVVLAEPLTVRGNAVVLDHGWGVLTGYWHLSHIEMVVGQEVQAGEVIGRVGSTGLSTGPHLHWDLWVGGVNSDGLAWLAPAYPWSDLDTPAAP